MNKFDFESKKYMIILLAIFIAFAFIVLKAFDYIPEQQGENVENVENININKQLALNNQSEQKDQSEDEIQQEQDTKKSLNIDLQNHVDVVPEDIRNESLPRQEELEKIEPISEASNNLSKEEQLALKFLTVQKLKDEKQYVKAIEEYKAIAESVSDTRTQAKCYEEIANIYGISKRYGTALSYAQQAYNLYPTSDREMLLARLYYKTGDLDKATKRMNNVLHREFSDDRK